MPVAVPDQLGEHRLVDVVELVDVEAARRRSCASPAVPAARPPRARRSARTVTGWPSAARTRRRQRRPRGRSRTCSGTAEADDRRTPHLRRLPRDPVHELQQPEPSRCRTGCSTAARNSPTDAPVAVVLLSVLLGVLFTAMRAVSQTAAGLSAAPAPVIACGGDLEPAPRPRLRPFAQVDVFSAEPYRGNPLAVVVDAGGLAAGRDAAVRQLDQPVGDRRSCCRPPIPRRTTGSGSSPAARSSPLPATPPSARPTPGWSAGGIPQSGRHAGPGVRRRPGQGQARRRPAGLRGAAADPFWPVDGGRPGAGSPPASGCRERRLLDASWLVNGRNGSACCWSRRSRCWPSSLTTRPWAGLKVGDDRPPCRG